jgi:hypothetical protein
LGELVREDVKLGTIFFLLILVTPGPSTSLSTRVRPTVEPDADFVVV